MTETVLSMQNICRVLPKKASDLHKALLREMLLPERLYNHPSDHHFYALKNINLDIMRGECVGVIGTHQGGKTLLANVSCGLLSPTSGKIQISGRRLLVSKPTAGFKPSLTLEENLGFRASLMGIYGEPYVTALDNALVACSLPEDILLKQIGDISPYLVKQLAFSLLMQIETDLLVVDELTHSGPALMRESSAQQLSHRINNCSSLIISSNPDLLIDITNKVYILDNGELSGPHSTTQALEEFSKLAGSQTTIKKLRKLTVSEQENLELSKNLADDKDVAAISNPDEYAHLNHTEYSSETNSSTPPKHTEMQGYEKQKKTNKLFSIVSLHVDDDPEYSHNRYALLKEAGDLVSLELVLKAEKDTTIVGAVIQLVERSTRAIFSESLIKQLPPNISKDENYQLIFSFVVPHDMTGVFGIALIPVNTRNRLLTKSQLKLLIMSVGNVSKHYINELPLLDTAFTNWKDDEDQAP